MSTSPNIESPEAADLFRLFRTSRAARRKLRETQAITGAKSGQRCLSIGGEPGVIPSALAARGDWTFVALRPEGAERMHLFLPDRPVTALAPTSRLDHEDSSFDIVVLIDVLERVDEDAFLVQECHRVLKDSGSLVIVATHEKKGLLASLRKLAGMGPESSGLARPGYTQRSLYDLLKNGFDITDFHFHSTFWEQLGELIQQVAAGLFAGRVSDSADDNDHVRRSTTVRTVAGVLTLPLVLLDALLGWGKGYQITARARARIWRERRDVKIRDGRSIADATINTKIGTAAHF